MNESLILLTPVSIGTVLELLGVCTSEVVKDVLMLTSPDEKEAMLLDVNIEDVDAVVAVPNVKAAENELDVLDVLELLDVDRLVLELELLKDDVLSAFDCAIAAAFCDTDAVLAVAGGPLAPFSSSVTVVNTTPVTVNVFCDVHTEDEEVNANGVDVVASGDS